jgi:hypothetical protein
VQGCGLDSCGVAYELLVSYCERGNKTWGSINGREFLD